MTDKVGRNDPCPCGSGKKYKKCCGQSNVIEFSSQVVSEELDQHWQELQDYLFDSHVHDMPPPDSDDEFRLLEYMLKLLHEGTVNQKTVAKYVERKASSSKRPMTQNALMQWRDTQPCLYRVLSQQSDGVVDIEDVFTKEIIKVSQSTFIGDDIDRIPYVTGFPMSWGSMFQLMPVALPMSDSMYQQLVKDCSDQQTFADIFRTVIDNWFNQETMDITVNELDAHPRALGVLDLLFDHKWGHNRVETDEQEKIVSLWLKYFHDAKPNFKKPQVMAAVLECFMANHPLFVGDHPGATFKDIAEQFSVNPTTLSKQYDEMDDFVFDWFNQHVEHDMASNRTPPQPAPGGTERMMYELTQQMSEQTFNSSEDADQYLQEHMNDPFVPKTNEQKSQLLVYDAYEANSERQKERNLDEALKLNPDNIDGLVLKSDFVESFDEKFNLLHQAIRSGNRNLDLSELQDSEMPWAMIEARGWFRAMEQLAELFVIRNEPHLAKDWFERLIDWNPNDNQGIRYRLVPIYIELNQLKDAELLLRQYDEQSTFWQMNWALLHVAWNNGVLNELSNTFLTKVHDNNPVIISYLVDSDYSSDLSFDPQMELYESNAEEYDMFAGNLWLTYRSALEEFLSRR